MTEVSESTPNVEKSLQFENNKWECVSYGAKDMFSQWGTSAFGLYTIFFYETVIGLPNEFAVAAFIIFSLWNAINDPFLGYIIEKFPMNWTKKRGYKSPDIADAFVLTFAGAPATLIHGSNEGWGAFGWNQPISRNRMVV